MDLSISRISFVNYRSYEKLDLDGIGPLTVFVGPNAAGKTNIVEGIQMLTAQTSFRHPGTEELLRVGASFARLEAEATDGNRRLLLEMRVEDGKKRFLLNGKAKRAADLKGLVPSVTFTPDDLELAKGSMSPRRAALDALGAQLSANHYLIRRDYEKVLRHKNRLLKDEASPLLIESVDEMVVTCGAQLCAYRSALFEKLSQRMSAYYGEIVGGREELAACYVPSWEPHDPAAAVSYSFGRDEARASISRALERRGREERERRRALVGPHADKVEFFIDGRNASVYGSQGQQRSAVLALKLAEASLVQDILHQKPVLLLDDVMSELDEARRRALVSFIAGDIQTFITTANIDYFDADLLAAARVVRLPENAGTFGDPFRACASPRADACEPHDCELDSSQGEGSGEDGGMQ